MKVETKDLKTMFFVSILLILLGLVGMIMSAFLARDIHVAIALFIIPFYIQFQIGLQFTIYYSSELSSTKEKAKEAQDEK